MNPTSKPQDSLYLGSRQFDREQAVFVVQSALIGALDRIESGLPTCIEWQDRRDQMNKSDAEPLKLSAYERGGLECTGMMLGVFYAQLTNDGLGVYDALACAEIDGLDFANACERLVRESWIDEGKRIKDRSKRLANDQGGGYTIEQLFGDLWPNTRKYAEAFVDRLFEFDATEPPLMV